MGEHYYTENPNSEVKVKHFMHTIKNTSLNFTSVSGVFSFEQKIDKASEMLIKNFTPSGNSLLDIGCGYGAIGLFLKTLFPEQKVHMIDVNRRAIEYASLNAASNHLEVVAYQSDLFSNIHTMSFDDLVTNPPIAAGKKLITDLINQSWDYLNNHGSLWLVAFHNKGGSTLKDIMKARFGNVEDVEKGGGIRVYKSIKKG